MSVETPEPQQPVDPIVAYLRLLEKITREKIWPPPKKIPTELEPKSENSEDDENP